MIGDVAATTTEFTPWASLAGGLLVGASAALLLAAKGRIAGISGIAGGLFTAPHRAELGWRLWFLAGMIGGGAALAALRPELFRFELERSAATLVIAGLLVGIGSRFANGCTSGHGICGLSRFSRRSLAATLTFLATGALTVYAGRHLLGVFP
jgi:uncharacterized membrane protein YedE/YeeE